MTHFIVKVRVRRQRPEAQGNNGKVELTLGILSGWTYTAQHSPPARLLGTGAPMVQADTHLDLYWVVLVEVDWRDSRDIEGACFTCETEKQQEPWPPNLLQRETTVGMQREQSTFLQGRSSGNLPICLHWPGSPLFWEA